MESFFLSETSKVPVSPALQRQRAARLLRLLHGGAHPACPALQEEPSHRQCQDSQSPDEGKWMHRQLQGAVSGSTLAHGAVAGAYGFASSHCMDLYIL